MCVVHLDGSSSRPHYDACSVHKKKKKCLYDHLCIYIKLMPGFNAIPQLVQNTKHYTRYWRVETVISSKRIIS